MIYEKCSQTKRTELQAVTRLGPDASRSGDPRVRSQSESMGNWDWLSNSIVHDLRNPVATIYAGAEMLMSADVAPAEIKRLAANVHRAAGRVRELLTEVSYLT